MLAFRKIRFGLKKWVSDGCVLGIRRKISDISQKVGFFLTGVALFSYYIKVAYSIQFGDG